MARPPRTTAAWRLPVVVLGLLLVPVVIEVVRSTTANDVARAGQTTLTPAPADADLIREAVLRYQIAHLVPNDLSPAAHAKISTYCVGLERSGGTDPPAALLEAIKVAGVSVAPYSSCVKQDMRGRVVLWVVSISMTQRDSAQAIGRAVQNSYVYALERRNAAWTVTAAKLTGRSSP